ncbi:MAG: hypothetical protein LBE38_03605 [Deltaproteobacteria bacterium]|jgi:hypothetical protein|nr:hypothetical protein [Deltaproteobacteria bacterium]
MRSFYLIPSLLALMALPMILNGCVTTAADGVSLSGKCTPVSEDCLGIPEKFYSQPQIRALESWKGRNVTELLAEWGFPDRVDNETDGKPGKRFIWIDTYTVDADYGPPFGYRFYGWPIWYGPYDSHRYRCRTYMIVAPDGTVTPAWVDKFGICTQFFNPKPSAPGTLAQPGKS